MDQMVHEHHHKLDMRNVPYRDGLMMMAILAARVPARQAGADPDGLAHQQDRPRLSIRPSVSGVPRAHRADWGRRQVAYIVADAHLLTPKLRTLSPHDTARRNDGWNALERVRLLHLAKRAWTAVCEVTR